jgi:hypothetical protein
MRFAKGAMAGGLLLIVIGATAACTTLPLNEAAQTALQGDSIGVASLQGSTLYRSYSGVTVFGNEADIADAADWKIDEFAVGLLLEQFTTHGYRKAVALSLGGADPASFYLREAPGKKPSVELDLQKVLALAAQQNLQAVALITRTPGNTEDPVAGTVWGSYGEFQKNLFGKRLACAYSMTQLVIIKVSTSETIASHSTVPCTGGYDALPAWKDSFAQYSDIEKEQIRSALSKRISAQIIQAIADMKL